MFRSARKWSKWPQQPRIMADRTTSRNGQYCRFTGNLLLTVHVTAVVLVVYFDQRKGCSEHCWLVEIICFCVKTSFSSFSVTYGKKEKREKNAKIMKKNMHKRGSIILNGLCNLSNTNLHLNTHNKFLDRLCMSLFFQGVSIPCHHIASCSGYDEAPRAPFY